MPDYSLFSVVGIEIEYMLVDKDNLNVQPKGDRVLRQLADGEQVNEVALDEIAISNELVMHVLELKNNGPASPNAPIAAHFQKTIDKLQPILEQENCMFLPSGAHPWMNPLRETERWPYGNHDIYQQFDKIFNCQGHGWSNLQSMHVNLPFANDHEFFQLHSAIRLLLPLLPALAASTPFLESKATGMQDSRLHFYGINQQKIPAISGQIIPEFIRSPLEYEQKVLQPMYQAIAPYDPDKILQFEWLNSRAAIPKFDYKAIEIRIIDSQECVNSDIAIARAIIAILKHWLSHSTYLLDNPCETRHLKSIYDQTIVDGMAVEINDQALCRQWQLKKGVKNCRDVWSQLIETVSVALDYNSQRALEHILSQGNLSERLLRVCGNKPSHDTLKQVYQQMGFCLQHNLGFSTS